MSGKGGVEIGSGSGGGDRSAKGATKRLAGTEGGGRRSSCCGHDGRREPLLGRFSPQGENWVPPESGERRPTDCLVEWPIAPLRKAAMAMRLGGRPLRLLGTYLRYLGK